MQNKCVCVFVCAHTQIRGHLGVGSLLLPLCGFQGFDSGGWALQPVPLPIKPSCQPFFLFYIIIIIYGGRGGVWCVVVTVKPSYLEAWEGLKKVR